MRIPSELTTAKKRICGCRLRPVWASEVTDNYDWRQRDFVAYYEFEPCEVHSDHPLASLDVPGKYLFLTGYPRKSLERWARKFECGCELAIHKEPASVPYTLRFIPCRKHKGIGLFPEG